MNKKILHTEMVDYLVIALAFQGISINKMVADRIVSTINAIKQKGGAFTISDALELDAVLTARSIRVDTLPKE